MKRILAQLSGRERSALIFCLAFIGATLVLSYVDKSTLFYRVRDALDPDDLAVRYTGTIVVPSQPMGRCRYTLYDNRTSEFGNSEIGDCYRKVELNSPYLRMNALRDTFKR